MKRKAFTFTLYFVILFFLCSPSENPYISSDITNPNQHSDTTKVRDTVFIRDTVKIIIRDTVFIDKPDKDKEGKKGRIRAEYFNDILGFSVENLIRSHNYPDHPNNVKLIDKLEIRDIKASSGVRLRGFLHPHISGNYRFYLVSDDQAQVWLSSDKNPNNKTLLVEETFYRGIDLWEKCPRSVEMYLQEGASYYIEVLVKQGFFEGHLQVGWSGPGLLERPIPGYRLSAYE